MQDENKMRPNNQHAIAISTFVTLLPLVYYIPPWIIQNLTDNHLFVTVISLMIIVPVISYIAMPLFIKTLNILKDR